MTYSKEAQAKRNEKNTCMVQGCTRPAGDSQFKGLCFHHRKVLGLNKGIAKEEGKKPSRRKKNRVKSDVSKWIEKLDSVFSVFIRLRDTDTTGHGRCISSGRIIWYFINEYNELTTNCDNGHYYSRRFFSLRWNEYNCHAQSVYQNRFMEGNKIEYTNGLIKKIGTEEMEKLMYQKNNPVKLDALILQKLYQDYEEKVIELLKTKSWYTGQRKPKSLYK